MAMSSAERAQLRSRIGAQRLKVGKLTSELRAANEILLAMERHLVDATKDAHGAKSIKKKK